MNHISPLLTIDSIALDRDITSRKRAFEALSLIVEHCAGVSHQAAFDAFNARERLGSTCMGGGVAIPHGRIKGLDGLVAAVLRTREPVVFDTPDGRRARLFFAVLIPEGDPDRYLEVLSDISELLKDRSAKEKLLSVATPLEFCEFVQSWTPPAAADGSDPAKSSPEAQEAQPQEGEAPAQAQTPEVPREIAAAQQ